MAGQDFARNEAPSRPQAGSVLSLMPVMAILLVALLCFAGGYWLGQARHAPAGAETASVDRAELANLQARLAQQQSDIEQLVQELQKWKALANRDASSKIGELQFYSELPKQKVMPAPLSGSAQASGTAPDIPQVQRGHEPDEASSRMLATIIGREMQRDGAYVVQVGSFRRERETRSLKQRLDGAGFSSFTEPVELAGKGRWVRVYVGPFDSRAAAGNAKRALHERLHIDGLVLHHKR